MLCTEKCSPETNASSAPRGKALARVQPASRKSSTENRNKSSARASHMVPIHHVMCANPSASPARNAAFALPVYRLAAAAKNPTAIDIQSAEAALVANSRAWSGAEKRRHTWSTAIPSARKSGCTAAMPKLPAMSRPRIMRWNIPLSCQHHPRWHVAR